MILRLAGNPSIDNLRHYPAESVETLRALLASGVPVIPDPHRKNFYDIQIGSQVFYVHITPSGKVLLLAIWRDDSAGASLHGDEPASLECAASAP